MTTARTLTALALTAALSPLLVACSDDAISAPPASAPTTAASSTSATPSASPDLSVAPPGETARQFIRRYYALVNETQRTGEIDALLAISGPDCDSCRSFARDVRKIYAAGGEIRGGDDTVTALEPESKTQWIATLVATPTEYEESAGDPRRLFAGDYTSHGLSLPKSMDGGSSASRRA